MDVPDVPHLHSLTDWSPDGRRGVENVNGIHLSECRVTIRDDQNNQGDLFDLIKVFENKVNVKSSQIPSKENLKIVNNLDEELYEQLTASLREVKTKEEIALIKKAVEISCQGQNEVMKTLTIISVIFIPLTFCLVNPQLFI